MHCTSVLSSESDPKCEINSTSESFAIEGEYRKYSCEVTYVGKWAPVMIWRIGGEKTIDVKNETRGNTVKFSIVVHVITAKRITCETKFVQPKRETLPQHAATNAPDYIRRYSVRAPTICCKYLFLIMCSCVCDRELMIF